MITVSLDANGLYTTQAGVARHIRGLLRGFQMAESRDVRICPLAWEVENFAYRQPARALKTIYRELVWAPWLAPARLRMLRPDLWHSTSGVLVCPPAPIRHVVTVHDLAVMHQSDRFRRWHRFSSLRRLRHLRRAERIICISHATADECMRRLELPARRIEVVYNGCDFHPEEAIPQESAPDTGLPDEFLLFVGSLEPGKNLALLRSTYELADREEVILPPLVILGARWEGVAGEGEARGDWIYLGRQPDSVLVHLYRHARALVFPSRYEGFGLPVAEAQALGCPVICSPVSSLPEVGGDAALYAAQTPAAYLEAIRSLLQEDAWRGELIERGRVQSRKFSWKRCATETIAVYQSVCP